QITCHFSTDQLEAGHLISNLSADTIFFPETDNCVSPFVFIQGVGCVAHFWEQLKYHDARTVCKQNYSSEMFSADTTQHFQRLVQNYLIDYLQID
ncbi:hypothetical protein SK128_024152, partial [Halocaridina rubra]